MAVPTEYLPLYNITWNTFGAMVTTFCDACGCKKSSRHKKEFNDTFQFLKSADIALSQSDTITFAKMLTAANTLLTSLQQ